MSYRIYFPAMSSMALRIPKSSTRTSPPSTIRNSLWATGRCGTGGGLTGRGGDEHVCVVWLPSLARDLARSRLGWKDPLFAGPQKKEEVGLGVFLGRLGSSLLDWSGERVEGNTSAESLRGAFFFLYHASDDGAGLLLLLFMLAMCHIAMFRVAICRIVAWIGLCRHESRAVSLSWSLT